MGQDHSIHGTNQAAGEGILPGERQLLDAIKRAGYARKDPERVCIYCGASFKTRENKEKHSTRCIRNAQTQKVSRATKEYICVRCSKMYRSKKALIDHADTCEGTMCCTSPLGSITQEGQEVEISVSAVQNSADIYASGPGLSAESAWTRPQHISEQ